MNAGIYTILQLSSGKHYVGSAVQLERRFLRHKSDLKAKRHHNQKLQRAWDKYGEDDFRFSVIEICDKAELENREQFWLDETLPFFNVLRKAYSGVGFKHSAESKVIMADKTRKVWEAMTPEAKAEKIERHAEKIRGSTHSDSTKLKMSESHKELPPNANSIRNLFEARKNDPEYYFKAADAHAKTIYIITNPCGEKESVRNLSAFCRKNGLNQSHMVSVAKGKRAIHKGWKCEYESPETGLDERTRRC